MDADSAGIEAPRVFANASTFDLGVQANTVVGLFKIAFSSLIGCIPDCG